jgi:hypothetical protein
MTGDLFINTKDAWTTWGVFLEDGSEDKLLQASPMKDYISNKSRQDHGKQVLATTPRVDERNVTVVFCFAKSATDFITRYKSFITELYLGTMVLQVVRLGITFNLKYISSATLSSMTTLGKVAVTFCEPDPMNR